MFGAIMAGIAVVKTIMDSEAEKSALNDEYNASVANAENSRKAGRYNMMRQQAQAQRTIGSMKADYGSSGVSLDSGSVLDVVRDSTIQSELDRLNIKYGAEVQAREYMSRGYAARSAAQSNAVNMPIRAGASALQMYASTYRGTSSAPQTSQLNNTSTGYGSAGGSYTDVSGRV